MWDNIIQIVFMVVVSAVIGGGTNHIAIQMLFRPYEAKYIGKWKVPFTPGLIPSRRDDLAKQLGVTVEEYLMTPEMLREKLMADGVKESINTFLVDKWNSEFINNEKTLKEYLEKFGKYSYVNKAETYLEELIFNKVKDLKSDVSDKNLIDLLGKDSFVKIGDKIPNLSGHIILKGIDYVGSAEGEQMIKKVVEDFLGSKGKLASVLGSFVGDSKLLNDKIRKEIVNVLKSDKTYAKLNELFAEELVKISNLRAEVFINNIDEVSISKTIFEEIKKEINLDEKLNKKITDYLPELDKKVREEYIPMVVEKGIEILNNNIEFLLEKVDIREIVKKEVDKFPVQELENLLLGLSKKEFKMITYLGFLLGGIIGFVQSLIVLLF